MTDNRLNIASSGGGGHLQAIHAYIANTLINNPNVQFPMHEPIERQRENLDVFIQLGSGLSNGSLKGPLSFLGKFVPIPLLPSQQELENEIESLKSKSQQPRRYIDMLLDVFPRGYESVAIWNCLQRRDATEELAKLLKLQFFNDFFDYRSVKQFFYRELTQKAMEGNPYTLITSTQPIGLNALCDAVIDYNRWVARYGYNTIFIEQFMTDLPTDGAGNFYKPLSALSLRQAAVMRVHAVGIDYDVLEKNLPNFRGFFAIVDINPRFNPMVRPGFTNPNNDKSKDFDKDTEIEILNEQGESEQLTIAAHQKMASIMLSSQAGFASIDYAKAFVEQGYLVFVFGGKQLQEKFDESEVTPQQRQRIILLANQDDAQITQIETRCHSVTGKGGGLSTMEKMAMPHPVNQLVLIHHADRSAECFTSGVSWEDGNVDELIQRMAKVGITVEKTTPRLAPASISHYQSLVKLRGLELPDSQRQSDQIDCSFYSLIIKAYSNRADFNQLFDSLDIWFGNFSLDVSPVRRKRVLNQYKSALFYYGIIQFSFAKLVEYLYNKEQSHLLHILLTFLLSSHQEFDNLVVSSSGDEFSSKKLCAYIQLLLIKFKWKTGALGLSFFGGDKLDFSAEGSNSLSIRIPKMLNRFLIFLNGRIKSRIRLMM